MAQRTDRDAAAKIKVASARNIPKLAARTMAEHQVEAAVPRHDILLEQTLYLRRFIVHHRRRRWNDFFHVQVIKRREIFSRKIRGEKKKFARLLD